MLIGFDGKRATLNNTGLGNYSRLVIDLLSTFYPNNRYIIYSPKITRDSRVYPLIRRDNVMIELPANIWKFLPGAAWRQWGITKRVTKDLLAIYHGLSGEIPTGIEKLGIPSVVTIHDLIFRRYPQYYTPIDAAIYNYKFRSACERATRIMAISDCTKRDIMSYYCISEERIDVVRQGCDESFRRDIGEKEMNQVKKRYSLPDSYILYVGTVEERKNLIEAVRALSAVNPDVSLVVVGRRRSYASKVDREIRELGLGNRVKFIDKAAFADLPAIYHMARVFVYPSRFEGFGIPMLEALCTRTPAIGATGSSLEEAGGPGSIYVDPDNPRELAEAITAILNDKGLEHRMIVDGLRFAEQFTPEKVARNIFDVYQRAIGKQI